MNYFTFSTSFGELQLSRYPQTNLALQAFDAADAYALNYVQQLANNHSRILIINDSFGALACSLAKVGKQVVSWGDSQLANLALQNNITTNQIDPEKIKFRPSTEPLTGTFDLVIIKVPKILALLEHQLCHLNQHITESSQIVVCAMVKHLTKTTNQLLNKYIGKVQPSLAVKKSRLLIVTPEPREHFPSPYPTSYQLVQPNIKLINHANVFCRDSLDIGSRFLLQQLDKIELADYAKVADLGCGNAVLAICLALKQPTAQFCLTDESYMAISSAQTNWQQNLEQRQAQFIVGDGLLEYQAASLNLILCNPPFHQQQSVGDFLAWRMLVQSHKSLTNGGQLWLVGNRHLGYHSKLKQLFNQVNCIASNSKFVVLQAIK